MKPKDIDEIPIATKKRMLLSFLRRRFVPRYKVRVRHTPKTPFWGVTEPRRGYIQILLHTALVKGDTEPYARVHHQLWVDTLIHEWAHAMTLHGNDEKTHGPEFGLMWAEILEAVDDWNWNCPPREDEIKALAKKAAHYPLAKDCTDDQGWSIEATGGDGAGGECAQNRATPHRPGPRPAASRVRQAGPGLAG